MELTIEALQNYLEAISGAPVQIKEMRPIGGKSSGAAALKQFGYGCPILITYQAGPCQEKVVFHRINRNAFGHERDEDRVAAVWFDFKAFTRLPRHVPAVDMVVQANTGQIHSIKTAEDLLLVTAFRPGRPYADDLIRLRDGASLRPLDINRAEALATYLAEIHQVKRDEPVLWRRRLRDLIGHGEGIMGLTDSYPPGLPFVNEAELRQIEEMANGWRWRLKPRHKRLCQVHGDFHPFNILFEKEKEFHVLDRSRGEWGEAADDVSCMTINYVFFSLQRYGRLAGPFQVLHERFWKRYLALQPDQALTTVIQPWLAWRTLVLASPVWYPTISEEVRRMLLAFARRVMGLECYDFEDVNSYLEAA